MPGTLHGDVVAILAPRGRDARIAEQVLNAEAIKTRIVGSLAEVPGLIETHIGALLIAEEALAGPALPAVRAAVAAQRSWSDIPFIVLTNGMRVPRSPAERERIDALGNVLLLARPLHRDDLVHAAKSALKARSRQFEALQRIDDLAAQEQLLQASERKFHAIANSVDQMIWSTRPDGYHDYYNDRWYEYTGVPRGSTDGAEWAGMFHPDDQARAFERWRHSLETGQLYEIEYRLRHRSGQYRWVLGKAQPVRDEHGRITRWYGSCTDIHEQVQVRQQLATSRDRLEQAVADRTRELVDVYHKTPVALHTMDRDERLVTVSDRWLRFMGYASADEVIGRPITDFIAPESLADHTGPYRAALLRVGVLDDMAYTCIKKNGARAEVLVSARVTLGEDRQVNRILASVIDVSQRKRAEAARDEAEAALRQSQKLETIGQLTGGVAHDFNNLLMAIRASLELLERRLPTEDERAHGFLQNAIKATERGSSLTQRMLAFARKQDLDLKPVDIGALLNGMRDLLERSLGPQIDMRFSVVPDLPEALIDPNQLELAILNLAVNARDAMNGVGKLELTVNCAAGDGVADLADCQFVRISVADSGPGMDAETLSHAMEPFFTTKGVGRGTGLGLSMVHGLASQSGGSFRLRSTPGEGTVAEIYVPLADTTEQPLTVPEPAPPEPSDAPRARTILAVDDDALVLMGTAGLLEDLGHRVLEAFSGARALELLEQHPDIDLVVTDQAMPSMTGVELAREIAARRPDLPIVLASGYAEIPEGAPAAIVARLEKPFSAAMLQDMLQSLTATVEPKG